MKGKLILLKLFGYCFPLILVFLVCAKSLQSEKYIIGGDILFALVLIFFSELFYNKKVYKIISSFNIILFNVLMFIKIAHYYLYGHKINASTLFILFETNINEVVDFLFVYCDFNIFLIALALLISIVVSIMLVDTSNGNFNNYKFYLILLFFIGILASVPKIRRNTMPYILGRSVRDYVVEKDKLKKLTGNRFGGNFSDVKHKKSDNREVYVLVIGESTSRNHMQLYNYYRNTNPELNKLENDLFVYKDVISPCTHTIPSLEKVLTYATNEFPNRKYDGTIIQLFNKAGFKTFWVSNQNPIGAYATDVTIISGNCDESYFLNANFSVRSLDEKVFDPFKKILLDKSQKKLIVVHLMGTHEKYSNRYSEKFDQFKDNPVAKFKTEKAFEEINAYDNAVLYNDFIISKLINEVSKTSSKSFVLYFSDHGEEVYDSIEMVGHRELNGTKPMYDIPFILWMSDKFKNDENNFVFDVNRKFTTEDMIYSLSDLAHISFKEFDSTRSIFNKYYQSKKRIIQKNKYYEDLFHHK